MKSSHDTRIAVHLYLVLFPRRPSTSRPTGLGKLSTILTMTGKLSLMRKRQGVCKLRAYHAATRGDVTETELSILQALWDLGPATVRQLVERLYPDAGPSAPATVQKLLERLEGKDYVVRDRGGPRTSSRPRSTGAR